MKVKQLIEELQQCNPEAEVLIDSKSNNQDMETVEDVQVQLGTFVIFSK